MSKGDESKGGESKGCESSSDKLSPQQCPTMFNESDVLILESIPPCLEPVLL